ncbi:glycoside hydrolase family 28 protein [Exserohilum turcica Et28A]|uniref:endo-polygalacturonase n=1 Tax=Exserohilum turcicum (strain 28A) TaxID=671987 RepID=R0K6K3_EXST2|nr:glycoside hydrolase family 28 protein [Exserohilum turcica Et28A]EOA83962.1 glycoside hydrolase family 28 protein [Exserohilum turcica Et28A]
MVVLTAGIFLASLAASASAAPAVKRAQTCTFSGATGAAAAASAAQSKCSTITLSNLAVPAGQTLDLSKLADGTTVIFDGTTTFGYKEWVGPLVSIGGSKITVKGNPGSVLDGDGARWWDGKGGNGGKVKPKFFAAHGMTSSTISGITIKNPPVQVVSINGANGLNIVNFTIDGSAGDKLGHNTDGFDISDSTNVVIDGAKVHNQDDCVAINSGTHISFTNGYCSGGHGLSIGSVGGRSNNVVDSVTFANSEVANSDNGLRIKAKVGKTGKISNITYNTIKLTNIAKFGVLVEQNYNNGDLHGKPSTGIPITGLTLSNISGDGAVSSGGNGVVIACGSGSSCAGWKWDNVNISGGSKSSKCINVPGAAACL